MVVLVMDSKPNSKKKEKKVLCERSFKIVASFYL